MKTFPKLSLPENEVLARLDQLRAHDIKFKEGRSFGLTYKASDSVDSLLTKVASAFVVENAFCPSAMPSVTELQQDLVEMTTNLLHGPPSVSGSVTSGGTESIFLAVRVACQVAFEERGLKTGSVVGPETAHPAFRKACELFSLKWISVPVGDDFQVSPLAFESALRNDTILAVGSAPSYPWGMIDDIPAMAHSASKLGIYFHVDACIGGFMLPFLEQLGQKFLKWDFRTLGVSSISVDLHKFGYGTRGASVILYRSEQAMRYQSFTFSDWPGGHFISQTLLGSKPVAPIATAWAVVNLLGQSGYRELMKKASAATERLKAGICSLPGVYVIGLPDCCVLAIGSDEHDIWAVGAYLRERGWYLGQQDRPPALHLMVTAGNLAVVDDFLSDLHMALRVEVPRSSGPTTYGDTIPSLNR